jgi:pimeloyl-ACP methyl ester carboxylesterase
MAASEEVVLPILTYLNNGEIDDSISRFAEEFTFKDRGIGLEFNDKERLAEFFQKTRELFPDSFLEIESLLVSADHVVSEWTLHTTITEPFYGGLPRKVQVSMHAQDQLEVKRQLGYNTFFVGAHDRGARVAHRMCLDHPEAVRKVCVMDIIPTLIMYRETNRELACFRSRISGHWRNSFLRKEGL